MTLQFSRSLYDRAAVEATIEAFADLATWTVSEDDGGIKVEMRDPSGDIDDLADHFANHVLHASITLTRRSALGAQQ